MHTCPERARQDSPGSRYSAHPGLRCAPSDSTLKGSHGIARGACCTLSGCGARWRNNPGLRSLRSLALGYPVPVFQAEDICQMVVALRPKGAWRDSPGQSDEGAAEERRPGFVTAHVVYDPEKVGRTRARTSPNPFRVDVPNSLANPGRRSLRSLALGYRALPLRGERASLVTSPHWSLVIGHWSFSSLVIDPWSLVI